MIPQMGGPQARRFMLSAAKQPSLLDLPDVVA